MTAEKQVAKNSNNSPLTYILSRYGGYFDGELHQFSNDYEGLSLIKAKRGFKPKIVIVSDAYYQERQLYFPVTNTTELNKLLKLQSTPHEINIIQNKEGNQSEVNSWQFSEEVLSAVPKALLVLPETLLIAQSCNNSDVVIITHENNQETYVTKFNGMVHSAKKSSLIKTVDHFSISAGIALHEQSSLAASDKAEALAVNIKKLSLNNLLAFVRKPAPKSIKTISLQLFLPGFVIFTLYLIITSIYITSKSALLDHQITQQSEEVTELLSLQSVLDDNLAYYQQLNLFWQDKQNTAGIWQILAPVFEQSTIVNVQLKEQLFYVRGRTPNASELLDSIVKNSNVAHSKFEAPVRKDRNQDSFYLSIELKKSLFLDINQDMETEKNEEDNTNVEDMSHE